MAQLIVVGAGLAGLTAALRLTQLGHSITVCEARDRVGGRVHTVALGNGAIVEMGGEWIRADQARVVALADELGVPLAPIHVDFAMRDLVGAPPIPAAEHERIAVKVATALAMLSARQRETTSAAELLDQIEDNSTAMAVLRSRIEGSAGMPLGAMAVTELDGDFGVAAAEHVRVAAGNQALANALADRLDDLQLECPVEAIAATPDGIVVEHRNGSLAGAGVVVSIPLPLLSKIRFEPALDPELATSVAQLTMGTAAKLAMATHSAPPLVARQSDRASAWYWTGRGSDGRVRRAVTGFAGSPAAIDAVAPDWPDQMRAAVPEVDFTGETRQVNWAREEWSQGCYSSLGPGDTRWLEPFGQVGRIVFAGEHTTGSGTIEGAITSGEVAAFRLDEYLTGAAAAETI